MKQFLDLQTNTNMEFTPVHSHVERRADKVQLPENRELTVQFTENRRADKMHATYGEQTG